MAANRQANKSPSAFRTISEVSDLLEVPQHVLRFWETKFVQVRPLKRGGGRRYYRPEDIDLLQQIRDLLYSEGYTIKGVQRLLREGRVKAGAGTAAGDGSSQAGRSGSPNDVSSRERRAELQAVLTELERLRDLLRGKAA
jgi:DNA-binding transcriptional MerR regulator